MLACSCRISGVSFMRVLSCLVKCTFSFTCESIIALSKRFVRSVLFSCENNFFACGRNTVDSERETDVYYWLRCSPVVTGGSENMILSCLRRLRFEKEEQEGRKLTYEVLQQETGLSSATLSRLLK